MEEGTNEGDEDAILAAAKAISECDFLLVATGAGFSADSGLPTYSEVAQNRVYYHQGIDYADLCRRECLERQPSLFYGFWGSCYNAYQEATPHEGYDILKRWCDHKEATKPKKIRPYHHYTSNVDGYLRRIGFSPECVHEMHGSIDTWLALDEDDSSKVTSHKIMIPSDFRFNVSRETLELAEPTINSQMREVVQDLPVSSRAKFRPRVLMFDDGFDAYRVMGLRDSSDLYQAWEEQMELKMCDSDDSLKLAVLEVGCGVRVPSVRQECQDVIHDTALRCLSNSTHRGGRHRCTHIRINPEDFSIDQPADELRTAIHTVSIRGAALSTLRRIDRAIEHLLFDA